MGGVLGGEGMGMGKGKGEEGMGVGVRVRVRDVEVRANEIEADGSGRLDRAFGAAEGGIWTAGDKVRVMEEVVGKVTAVAAAAVGSRDQEDVEVNGGNGGNGGNVPSSTTPPTIYIGDSPTDLACLLRADVGICVRDGTTMSAEQRELKRTLERIGVRCLHVGAFGQHGRVEEGEGEGEERDGDGGRKGEERGEREGDGEGARKGLWWAADFDEVCGSGVLGEMR